MWILLAEDEKALREATCRGLARAGVNADACDNGEDALHMLCLNDYDAAVLDILMPRMDGMTALRAYRAEGGKIPVLLLTAMGALSDRVDGLDAGADDYLVKPFAFEELMARLRALTRRKMGEATNEARVGALTVDFAARIARMNGTAAELSAREFDVLAVLMRNAGVVLTRAQIEEKVWRAEADIGSNVVDVYVRSLRRKLGESAPIHTVRGVGYVARENP